MRYTKLAALAALLLPLSSWADLSESPALQVKTRQVSAAENFWSSFWDVLRGKQPALSADLSIKVMKGDGSPLGGATVLVGQKKGDPFAGNTGTTDTQGMVSFSHERLRSGTPVTITVAMDGFSTLSVVGSQGNLVEVQLQKIPAADEFNFLSGKVTGFPPGHGSGTLEFGLFLPAFRPDALLNFDPQQFVSSYKTKIDVFGEREVPGNLVLPAQRKRYGFIPITLSKPEFIMPLPRGLSAHMTAIAGNVAISPAVSAIKNKDFLQALNLASLTHIGWTNRRVDVRRDERFDLDATHELEPKAVSAKFAGMEPKLDAVAVSLFDPSGDMDFLPMDVKALKAEEFSGGAGKLKLGLLKQRKASDRFYVFAGAFDRNQLADKNATSRWIVGSLTQVKGPVSPEFGKFLKPIQSQGVDGARRAYKFSSAANTKAGLTPSFVLVNIVSEKKNDLTQGKTRTVLWSAVLPGNAQGLTLPDLGRPVLPPADASKEERFLWEVIAVRAGNGALGADLDIQSALRDLKHVSTLSQKF